MRLLSWLLDYQAASAVAGFVQRLMEEPRRGRDLNQYTEKRMVLQDIPFADRPVVETPYLAVVKVANAQRRVSGVAVAALVVAAMTAIVITILIANGQQRKRDEQLVRDQARIATAQQTAVQSRAEQALIVKAPPSQPAILTAASPLQRLPFDSGTATTNAGFEIEVTSLLQNDQELRRYAVFVKATRGVVTLSGQVPDEDLRKRAEKLARTVTAIRNVINEIAVRP